jgi:eukaryotic-like serine/threonine-protein kinase
MPLEKLGPYKLERLLGRGGMGAVYVGLHEGTGERAAIKLLSGHLADDEAFRERFKQEIETLKRLLHPNIVQLHGYGEEEGHLYFVMELVQGRCLQEELVAGRRFNWREVARIGIAIAKALKHAHDRGIIHRDLKPANLLIDTQDHIKLTDFGIAKLYGGTNVTAEGGVLGTADYMAPEQADGKQVTSRCDLYALGSVLYALLAGKPPFAAKSIVEVITALQKEKPVPVRRLAPDTPEEFEKIIQQLLEKDPTKRIPTALALANRLKAMEHGLSLETRVIDPQGPSDPDIAIASDVRPSSAKTDILNPASSLTARMPGATDDNEYRLAGDDPTLVTGVGGGAAPSSRTALGTQAGKRTGAGSSSGTQAESGEPAAPTPKLTRFTTVSEDDLRGRRASDDTLLKQWGLAAALAVVGLMVVAGAVYFATRPPSADRLYAAVKTAAARGSADALVPVEAEITRFLELYPDDPRFEEVKHAADDLKRYRLDRRLEVRARRGRDTTDISPVERAYQRALQLTSTDPEAALTHFEALVAVYGPLPGSELRAADKRTEQCLQLAEQQIARLRPEVEKLAAEQRAAVRQQLERADQLSANDRKAAERIWQGLITLYEGKTWANDLVAQARENLHPPTGDPPH